MASPEPMGLPVARKLYKPALQCMADGKHLTHPQLTDRLLEKFPGASSAPGKKNYQRLMACLGELRKAVLVTMVGRGVSAITERGKQLVEEDPPKITPALLRRYPEYVEAEDEKRAKDKARTKRFKAGSPPVQGQSPAETASDAAAAPVSVPSGTVRVHAFGSRSPSVPNRQSRSHLEQRLMASVQALNDELEAAVEELLNQMEEKELVHAVRKLLLKMGYGSGSIDEEVTGALARGTTLKDALGFNQVYIQVTSGQKAQAIDLQGFVGAFSAAHAERGIFVSIAGFTGEARGFAMGMSNSIQIMDVSALSRLLVTHGVGIKVHARHTVKRVDPAYFEKLRA